AADPGVIDQDVELAPGGDCRLDRRLPLRLAGHVELAEHRRAVRPGNLGDDVVALLFQHVGDADLGALAREDPRHAGAHARGGTGDQRNLVFQPHAFLPAQRLLPRRPREGNNISAQTTAIWRRRSPVNSAFGIIAWTPRTMSTT